MTKVIDRNGKGSDINVTEFDANYSSLAGINEAQTGTTYTVTIDDQNRTIEISNAAAVTVTLTAIATIAAALHTDDFKVTLKNIGAGVVTVNRSSTDTFDDTSTSQTIEQYNSLTIQTDSTGGIWNIISEYAVILTGKTVNDASGYPWAAPVLIETLTASASATIEFTTGIDSAYKIYIVEIINAVAASASQTLYMRVSDDGGSTFKSGASDYLRGGTGFSFMRIQTFSISTTAADGGVTGRVTVYDPESSSVKTMTHADVLTHTGSLVSREADGAVYDTAATIDAFQFLMSSGNITSGVFKLYGIP